MANRSTPKGDRVRKVIRGYDAPPSLRRDEYRDMPIAMPRHGLMPWAPPPKHIAPGDIAGGGNERGVPIPKARPKQRKTASKPMRRPTGPVYK
jgi:hypothetical protein